MVFFDEIISLSLNESPLTLIWLNAVEFKPEIPSEFIGKEFIELNLFSDVGDLILFRNNFYEVDSRIENQLALG